MNFGQNQNMQGKQTRPILKNQDWIEMIPRDLQKTKLYEQSP